MTFVPAGKTALYHFYFLLVSSVEEVLLGPTHVHCAHFVMLPVCTMATAVKAKCKCGDSVLGCEFMSHFKIRVYFYELL